MSIVLKAHLKYYGISPWEIEVAYGCLNSRFDVIQEEIQSDDENFEGVLNLDIPLAFNQEFFNWFEFKRWENLKFLFKEMKRRRGKGHPLKIQINFSGSPKISFVIDTNDKQRYNNSVEKIDFVLELLPYHLDPKKLPSNVTQLVYRFDADHLRWGLKTAYSGQKMYEFKNNIWNIVT